MVKFLLLFSLFGVLFTQQRVLAQVPNNSIEVSEDIIEANFPNEVSRYQNDSKYTSDFNNLAASYFNLKLDDFKFEEEQKQQWKRYTFEDENRLINISNIMNVSTVTFTQLDQTIYGALTYFINESGFFNIDDTFKDQELEFLSLTEVKNQADQLLTHFDLNLDYQLKIYGIRWSDIQPALDSPEGKAFLEYNKPSQTEESNIDSLDFSDFYYVTADFYLEGLPLNQLDLGDQERGVVANVMSFSMIITPSGLVSIDLQGVVQPHATNEKVKILDSQQVIDKLQRKYDNIILQEPIKLIKLDLVYVPYISMEANRELVPTWQGLILQEGETGQGREEFTIPVFIDAITGDEVAF